MIPVKKNKRINKFIKSLRLIKPKLNKNKIICRKIKSYIRSCKSIIPKKSIQVPNKIIKLDFQIILSIKSLRSKYLLRGEI